MILPKRKLPKKQRDNLILQNMSVVRYMVSKFSSQLPPRLEVQDIYSAAVLGLINAANKFDPKRGLKFSTLANYHVRGAILDEFRVHDTLPRSLRDKSNTVTKCIDNLSQQLYRKPTDTEVAEYLGLEVNEYLILASAISTHSTVSLDEPFEDNDGNQVSLTGILEDSAENNNPQFITVHKEVADYVTEVILALPIISKLVIILYYVENISLLEIGGALGVSESRVSQIVSKATVMLRELVLNHPHLGEYIDNL